MRIPEDIEALPSPNYYAGRGGLAVDRIIIHTTEGGYQSSIDWLRSPVSGGSATYIINTAGTKAAMLVGLNDTAWHCGNSDWNARSVGIEHEGYAGRGGFSDAMYRISAQMAAYVCQLFGLVPEYKKTFFAHNDVPQDPNNWHTDPGPHWNWPLYISYVKQELEKRNPMPPTPPTFDPNPLKIPDIGVGMYNKLIEIGQTALTPERYTGPNSGTSMLIATGGYVLFAVKEYSGPGWQVVAIKQ